MIPIIVINLDRQPERLNSVQRELRKVGLEFTRFPAIDMQRMDRHGDELVTLGVAACWQSHVAACKSIAASESSHALILEDDIEIHKRNLVKDLLTQYDFTNFDIVQIGYLTPGVVNKLSRKIKNIEFLVFKMLAIVSHKSPVVKSRIGNRLRVVRALNCPIGFIPDDFLPGTHAYLISSDLAKKIEFLNDPQFLSADDFFSALSKMRSFNMIRTRISWVGQKKFDGIGNERFLIQ